MNWWQRLFNGKRMERDLDSEIRFHLEQQIADKVRAGMTEDEARRITRLEFGGLAQIKEDCRERRGTLWVASVLQDLRFALRQLRNTPRASPSPRSSRYHSALAHLQPSST